MKRPVLALLCLALIALVGCQKETIPSISFITTGNYANSTTEILVGQQVHFGVNATAGPFGKGISKIQIDYSNGDESETFTYDNEDSPSRSWAKTFDEAGKVTLTATAYDGNGETATATLEVTVLEAETPDTPGSDTNPFIGTYICDGMTITGHVYAELGAFGNFDDDVDMDVTGGMVITAGASYNDVVVAMEIEGETYNIDATTDGNNIIFDQSEVNIPFSVGTFSLSLRVVLNGMGTLANNVMDYNGTIGEQAYVSFGGSEIPAAITDGKTKGTFTKTTVE